MTTPAPHRESSGPAHHLEEAVVRSVWRALTGTPGLERLYPGYYVTVADTVAHRAEELRAAAVRPGGPVNMERLEVELAGDIVCHLGRQVRHIPVLNLIARDLPAAIDAALAPARRASPGS